MRKQKSAVTEFFLFILFFISIINPAKILLSQSSGWFWQNPLPQGNNLTSVKFVNQNTVYTAGYTGTVLKSTDSGNSWNYHLININYNYLSVYFIDISSGFAAGYYFENNIPKGIISKTTDGGTSWNNYFPPGISTINSIFFYNMNTGFAVDNSGQIIKTTNNGITWTNNFSAGYPLYIIQFLSNNTGYAAGRNGELLKTTNSGINWNYQVFPTSSEINSIYFLDSLYGYALTSNQGEDSLFKTYNGGLNWSALNLSLYNMNSILFININTGFVIGGGSSMWVPQSIVYKTTDGGNIWNFQSRDSGQTLNSISYIDNNFVAVGNGGIICKNSDTGNNWYPLNENKYIGLYSDYFLDANTGFAGGLIYTAPTSFKGVILKTTNTGENWTTQYVSQNILCFYFINSNTGFAAGGTYLNQGRIFKTTNKGINWTEQNYFGPAISDLMFPDVNTGYAISSAGPIYKTTSGGENWADGYYYTGHRLNSIYCFNSNQVFIAGDSGLTFKTSDGGNTWNIRRLNTNSYLYSWVFINNQVGFITADSGQIFKTSDGGVNWSKFSFGSNIGLTKIKFADNNTGFVVASNGLILKTTNTGLSWYITPNITGNSLNSIFLINSSTGYAVGQYGTILKTTTGGEPIGIIPIGKRIPVNYSLLQNYPNPFNPATKIKFEIPEPSHAIIKIFDVLGCEVAILVNEMLQPGTYELKWDASNFASGIYFYRLKTESYTQTRKMVVVK